MIFVREISSPSLSINFLLTSPGSLCTAGGACHGLDRHMGFQRLGGFGLLSTSPLSWKGKTAAEERGFVPSVRVDGGG